jgi:phosphoglycerate kinase
VGLIAIAIGVNILVLAEGGMMKKKVLRDVGVKGKRVLVRVDFNVPLDPQTLAITDDTRIRAALPTIKYLIKEGAKVILCSHLGRPQGKVVEKLRIAPVASQLSQILKIPVRTTKDCIGAEAEAATGELKGGEVLMLENLSFHPEEQKNDSAFAKALANLAEVYVNDAFGVAHRAYASTVGVTKYLPSAAGFLLEKEVDTLTSALDSPDRPCVAIIGGAKAKDKISLVENMMRKVNSLLVGGGMSFAFLKASEYNLGRSPVPEAENEVARRLVERSDEMGVHLLLPVDVVVAKDYAPKAKSRVVSVSEVPPTWQIMDIGPKTVTIFTAKLRKAKTVIWTGSLGVFEFPNFRKGTTAIVELLAKLDATKVIAGGSIAEAIEELGLTDKMTHVSTGGGAALRLFGGIALPAVEALPNK